MKPSLSPGSQTASSSYPGTPHIDVGSRALLLRVLLCAATLASYGLLTGNLGRLEDATSRYLGLLALVLVIVLARASREASSDQVTGPRRRWSGLLLSGIGLLLAVRYPHIGLPWTLLCLTREIPGRNQDQRENPPRETGTATLLRGLAGGVLFAGLVQLALSSLVHGWWIGENLTALFRNIATTITRREVSFGATALGLPILFVAIGTWAATGWLTRFHRPLVWLLVGLSLIAAVVLQTALPDLLLTLLVGLVDLVPRAGIGVGSNRVHTSWLHGPVDWLQLREPWHHLWMLTVLLSLPLSLSLTERRRSAVRRSRLQTPCWIGAALVLPFAFLLRASDSESVVRAAEGQRTALVFNAPHLDMRTPNFNAFMERSGGMFGMLPRLLQATGHHVEVGTLDDGRLERADLLVLVNLQRSFSDATRERILERVEQGASLLVLSDHTGMESIREPVNHLLGDLGMELRFDSAVAFDQTWQDQMAFQLHPATRGLTKSDDTQIWIGASIEVRPPARPLVVGKYAYGDPGNVYARDRNFLGDLAYGRGEPLGDLPLVAARCLGEGRILLFGDTSTFQNMSSSLGTRFCIQSLRWLAGEGGETANGLLPSLALLVLVTLGVLWIDLPALPTLLVGVSIHALPAVLLPDDGFPAAWFQDRIAVVQAGHGERINLDTTEDHSVGGLVRNLVRNDFFPLVLRHHEPAALARAEVVFLIAATRVLEESEVDDLVARAESGGLIVVCTASPDSFGVEPLLSRLGVSVEPIPLGSLTIPQDEHPVELHDASPLTITGRPHERLLEFKGYLVGASLPIGSGKVVVIGDTDFLLNHNLEGRENVEMGNVFFLRRLLSEDRK